MKPPEGKKLFEGELATFWFDENGILCAVAKDSSRTLQKQKETYAFLSQITGNKKVCLLADTTNASSLDKETRDYIEREMPNYFKAMAVISSSPLGEVIPKFFLTLNKPAVPIQYFTDENEAREWLKQYL